MNRPILQLRLFGIALVVTTMVGSARSQDRNDNAPSFDAASIRPSKPMGPGDRIGLSLMPGGRLSITNFTLKQLITFAFDLKRPQVLGGPGWIDADRFDIEAKPETAADIRQGRRIVQTLLAERFKLTFHRETREMPVYALVVARNGPKLVETKPGGAAPLFRVGPGTVDAQGGATLAQLASVLAGIAGRTVVDKTGISGIYDLKLEWTPSETDSLPDLPIDLRGPDGGPSIFTAVQEQLGLKLESQKGPVEILVVDRAERPSEN
jgi:uncharacterized protein (TIGR03435 family)